MTSPAMSNSAKSHSLKFNSSCGDRPLSSVATGRTGTLFSADLVAAADRIRDAVSGKRVLCIGAAGSIGSSTTTMLAGLNPAALHVIDQNENGLAELVRSFRARGNTPHIDFRALPLDYGSSIMDYFLAEQLPYDLVLNFAAIKHVRSEKDAFSVLQMFETNLSKQARLLKLLGRCGFSGRYFSVSTDKAANPTSMMGATKRVMEHVMFDHSLSPPRAIAITSARFANVAFSNGSLLQSFEMRMARGEPLAAPRDTKRYFVSLEESGQICLVAATVAPHASIVIPRLDPTEHLVLLEDVAEGFLERHGYKAAIYEDEAAARANVEKDRRAGQWPLLLTALDTSGEKPYEEFVGEGESVHEIGFPNLCAVSYRPASARSVTKLLARIDKILDKPGASAPLNKDELKAMIAEVEPRFLDTHRETGINLDQRM